MTTDETTWASKAVIKILPNKNWYFSQLITPLKDTFEEMNFSEEQTKEAMEGLKNIICGVVDDFRKDCLDDPQMTEEEAEQLVSVMDSDGFKLFEKICGLLHFPSKKIR